MNQAHTHTFRGFNGRSEHISSTHFPLQHPLGFHDAPRAGGGNSEKAGNQGHCLSYLDDTLIMVSSKEEARAHLATAVLLLIALGFILNFNKSVLTPIQRVTFLRFCMDSCTMLISLPTPRIQSVQLLIRETLPKDKYPFSSYLNSWAQWYPLIKQFWELHCITIS